MTKLIGWKVDNDETRTYTRVVGDVSLEVVGKLEALLGGVAIPMRETSQRWEVVSTGGGCEALSLALPDGGCVMITDMDGINLPVDGERALLGVYDDDGQQVWSMAFDSPDMPKENDRSTLAGG